MPRYAVTIKMTVTKTYIVEADTKEDAIDLAYEISTVLSEDGIDENYSEDIMDTEELVEA
jgi:hypothetical protein